MATPRRRKIGHRRRLEDEGDDEGGPDAFDLDDDSASDGSALTDDHDAGDDSDTSNVEDASPTSAGVRKVAGPGTAAHKGRSNGGAKKPSSGRRSADAAAAAAAAATTAGHPLSKPADADLALRNLSLNDDGQAVRGDGDAALSEDMHFDDVASGPGGKNQQQPSSDAPVVVSSASATRPSAQDTGGDRRRREHEEYKRRRDEDPSFVPNRGAFFMHDHRHAGPAANGFRPFARPTRGRGGGRGGFGGSFGGHFQNQIQQQHANDPTTSGQWAHDMHEAVVEPVAPRPVPPRPTRGMNEGEGPPNGNGIIPTCPMNSSPINRTLSTEKHIGNAQVRVFFVGLKEPIIVPGLQVKQYTKLPDHRPPLRRDKPVRISLPNRPPRYVFPAVDRSFIFIPRAMRPNQKPGGMRGGGGKTRSVLGSVGGWSRRTSVYGGSYYGGGSTYSPSIALSRRSSLAPDGRDYLFSPTGSVVSRAAVPVVDPSRPVVRLPPQHQVQMPPPMHMVGDPHAQQQMRPPPHMSETSITDLPQPQTHPLPQKPTFQETQSNPLTMHQPRPHKTVSVADIESPTLNQQPPPQQQQQQQQQMVPQQHQPQQQQYQQPQGHYQGAFHQQVPVQVSNGFPPEHSRQPSYQSQHSTGTPLSQIPERAIHAAPFQPNYGQQGYFGQPYPGAAMQPPPPQQAYYYAAPYNNGGMQGPPSATAPTFVPGAGQQQQQQQQQQGQGSAGAAMGYPPNTQDITAQQQHQQAAGPPGGPGQGPSNLVAQEVNGTFYFFDPSQMPPPAVQPYAGYHHHPAAQQGGFVPMGGGGGVVNPSPVPDGYYPYQATPGMMYYAQ